MNRTGMLTKIKEKTYPLFLERVSNDKRFVVKEGSVQLAGSFYEK